MYWALKNSNTDNIGFGAEISTTSDSLLLLSSSTIFPSTTGAITQETSTTSRTSTATLQSTTIYQKIATTVNTTKFISTTIYQKNLSSSIQNKGTRKEVTDLEKLISFLHPYRFVYLSLQD